LVFILSFFSFLNPVLMQFGLIFIGFTLLWLLMPLFFSTHGIFAFQDNLLAGMLNSARIVRYFLPATGFFIVAAILISEGLDVIWMFPPEDSWMTLVGIAGHAFIATSLVASSFAFYRQGITFINQRLPISDQTKSRIL
jgi:hypothetical protein